MWSNRSCDPTQEIMWSNSGDHVTQYRSLCNPVWFITGGGRVWCKAEVSAQTLAMEPHWLATETSVRACRVALSNCFSEHDITLRTSLATLSITVYTPLMCTSNFVPHSILFLVIVKHMQWRTSTPDENLETWTILKVVFHLAILKI